MTTLAPALRPPVRLPKGLLASLLLLFLLLGVLAIFLRPSPPIGPTNETVRATVPLEATRTVEASTSVPTHNQSNAPCITCHLLPATHEIDPYTCADCHAYDDWHTATHPNGPDCASCHSTPRGHVSTSEQCSLCHKNPGDNWNFRHPGGTDCATCHRAPKGHYGTACATCHDPSIPWSDTRYKHSGTLDCVGCHSLPHRAYPATCVSCHPNVGGNWSFAHPKDSVCQNCHAQPADHYGNNCSACHTPSVPWAATASAHDAGATDCARCHTPPHRADYPVACTSCHPQVGVAWLPAVHTPSTNCVSCHTAPLTHPVMPIGCNLCHSPAVPWVEGTHPNAQSTCTDCHTPPHASYAPSTCIDCHPQLGVAWLPVTHPTRTDCGSCHTPAHGTSAPYAAACMTCHSVGATWTFAHPGSTSDCVGCHAGYPDAHHTVVCGKCHTASDGVGPGWSDVSHDDTSCNMEGCHSAPVHNASMNCVGCHTPPHASYAPSACIDCHPQLGVAWLPITHPTRTDCASCHTPTHGTAGPYSAACNSCHSSTTSWTAAHPAKTSDCLACHAGYPTAHQTVVCGKCHTASDGVGPGWSDVSHDDSSCNMEGCHDDGPSSSAVPSQAVGTPEPRASRPDTIGVDATATPVPGAEGAPVIPAAPRGFDASVRDDHAILTWAAENGADYEVQSALDAGFSGARDVWSGAGGKVELGPYAAGDIWFRIRARHGADGHPGPWSAVAGVTFPPDKESSNPPAEPEKAAVMPENGTPTPPEPAAADPPAPVEAPSTPDPQPPVQEPSAAKPKPPVEEPAAADPPAPVEESTPAPTG